MTARRQACKRGAFAVPRRTRVRAKIAKAIEGCGGKATVRQISAIMEWPYSTVARHVKTLVASGFLVDTGERLAEGGRGFASAVYTMSG